MDGINHARHRLTNTARGSGKNRGDILCDEDGSYEHHAAT